MDLVRAKYARVSASEECAVWRQWRAGVHPGAIAQAAGMRRQLVEDTLKRHGGITPPTRTRAARTLSLAEREAISRGLARDDSVRAIARQLQRAPSTISREIARHGGRTAYRALAADRAAWAAAGRPKPRKLVTTPRLWARVHTKLRRDWSPEQIAAWLRRTFPHEPTMQVSHETIYKTLYLQTRGALKREVVAHLRRHRPYRHARTATARGTGRGQLIDIVSISERPATVADRAVPGHWEGDLLFGGATSQVVTLVERHSRYVLLARTAGRDSASVVRAVTRRIRGLPASLKQSLTWDRGKELAHHKQFTVATDVRVYFCDPQSPWQRGSNENTNGLLRQYLPKGAPLDHFTQRQLDAIARKLNTRPRETLGWQTPADVFAAAVASTT